MSIGHIEAVLYRMPELRERGAALALLAISDSADRETGFTFWKTMRDLALAARLSIRGARYAVRYLEQHAYVRTELRGEAGAQTMRWRVLFDRDGVRRAAEELYQQPQATAAGGKRRPPAKAAGAPAMAAEGSATTAAPPATTAGFNETGTIRPSPSPSQERAKARAEEKAKAAAALSDEELEQRARDGCLTAHEEYEREHRRRMRPRRPQPEVRA